MKPLAAAGLAISAIATCTSGYPRLPVVEEGDVQTVLIAAARIVADREDDIHAACFVPTIERSFLDIGQKSAGWENLPGSENRFRELTAPKPVRIPDAAIAVLGRRLPLAQCSNKLVFEPPVYMAFDKKGRISKLAFVNFHRDCPLCGGGYTMSFEWTGGRWVADKSGITQTWMS